MAKTGKNKLGIPCIYCGLRPSTKKGDHAVAKALFLEPFPSDMVTVPACIQCNKEKDPLDSYLRDTLVSDIAASRNLVARQLLTGKVSRCIATNRSPFYRTAFANARRVPMFTPRGLYVDDVISVPVDDKKIRRVLRFMVRGLFYWVRDERVPDYYQYEVGRIQSNGIGDVWDMLAGKSEGAGQIGDDVFACRYLFALEDRFISYWLLVFYNSIAYTVTVVPRGGLRAFMAGRSDLSTSQTGGINLR